jgi:hypothetical protein
MLNIENVTLKRIYSHDPIPELRIPLLLVSYTDMGDDEFSDELFKNRDIIRHRIVQFGRETVVYAATLAQ